MASPPTDPDPDVDDDMDPTEAAMAAAMGFSSFGNKVAGKKRKYTAGGDAFVESSTGTTARKGVAGSGANMVVLGERGAQGRTAGGGGERAEDVDGGAVSAGKASAKASGAALPAQMEGHDPAAYRRGVVNERGDTVYFLPSFLEDPWAELGRGKG